MPKLSTMAQLQKLLSKLPVSQREALVRRAELRSVDGNSLNNLAINSHIGEDILCQPSTTDNELFNATSLFQRQANCSNLDDVPGRDRDKRRGLAPSPINNFPKYDTNEGGVPDAITLEVFSLRRKNAELESKVVALNNKMTRILELLNSLRRFFRLWIFEDQGETYDQIRARMYQIDATIMLVEDRSVGPAPEMKLPERWTKEH